MLQPSLVAIVPELANVAANDNPFPVLIDNSVAAALAHFGRFGLAAAQIAQIEAEAALANNDTAAFGAWQAICAQLDRRLGKALEHAANCAR